MTFIEAIELKYRPQTQVRSANLLCQRKTRSDFFKIVRLQVVVRLFQWYSQTERKSIFERFLNFQSPNLVRTFRWGVSKNVRKRARGEGGV